MKVIINKQVLDYYTMSTPLHGCNYWTDLSQILLSESGVVWLQNVKITMDRTCNKWGCSEENKNYKETVVSNQKETAECFGIHNEERKPRGFNTQ